MQQMQLWIFWAILVAFSLRLHPHAETKKKATNENLVASGAERTSARLFREISDSDATMWTRKGLENSIW